MISYRYVVLHATGFESPAKGAWTDDVVGLDDYPDIGSVQSWRSSATTAPGDRAHHRAGRSRPHYEQLPDGSTAALPGMIVSGACHARAARAPGTRVSAVPSVLLRGECL